MKNITLVALTIAVLALLPGNSRAQADNRLVSEGVVSAPVDQVWAAFATKAGLESWMAAHAEIELKLGGAMRAQHDPQSKVGDPSTIENTILSYEPKRMLSFKVAQAPEGFPFPNAIKNMWTVVYFEAVGENSTRVREVSMGFGDDDESKKMREFFKRGNAFTLQQLQKRFTAKAGTK